MGTRWALAKQNHEIVPQKWHLRKNPNSFYNGTKHKKLSFKFFVRRGAKNWVFEKKKRSVAHFVNKHGAHLPHRPNVDSTGLAEPNEIRLTKKKNSSHYCNKSW